ncbi:MAG: DUF45 domain-containing protein [Rhodocyclaceae bacterium]|nr:DUF45 domain-containing protein [Rhodocyclaceae bacterium]
MKTRNPQLALRLDGCADDIATRWHDGAPLAYLGTTVTLRPGTGRRQPVLEGDTLHLPLPPEASPRQIQDAAEAWLRAQAVRLISAALAAESRRLGRPAPESSLSFAGRASWVRQDDNGGLRFHWRLVEQPEDVIGQAVRRAIAGRPAPMAIPDLFSAA